MSYNNYLVKKITTTTFVIISAIASLGIATTSYGATCNADKQASNNSCGTYSGYNTKSKCKNYYVVDYQGSYYDCQFSDKYSGNSGYGTCYASSTACTLDDD